MQPSGRNRLLVRVTLAALFAVVGFAPLAHAQQAVFSENEVKAAFLYHFGSYVQWPPAENATEPVSIAVMGAPAIAEQLQRFLPERSIQGRPVVVREIAAVDDLVDDEILFIGAMHNDDLESLIERVAQQPVLVVTDARDGLERGAMVNFQIVDQRVRFEISLRAAQNAGLMLSARLLSAALRVETVNCRVNCHEHDSIDLARRIERLRSFPALVFRV